MAVADQSRSVGGTAVDECAAHPHEAPCSDAERRGLLLVGLYKLAEAVLFIAVGAGALHLIHKNIGDVIMHLVDTLRIDPEGRLVSIVMDKADLIDAHDLRRIGAGAFAYACIRIIEGTGLLMHKTWAEYFTIIMTAVGLPVEVFEMMHRFTWLKMGVFVANLAILFYLLWILKSHQRTEREARSGA